MSKMHEKSECRIIRDILPSYADKLTSEKSNSIIEEHLAGCDECRAALDTMMSGSLDRKKRIRKAEKAYLRHMNFKRKRPLILGTLSILLAIVLMYLFLPGLFGDERLSREQRASLTQQYEARNDLTYEKYLPDKIFADILIYGAERKNDRMLIYTDISEGEYVKIGNAAYDTSGGSGPCVLHAKVEGKKLKLDGVVYPEDGMHYTESLRKLFPLRYYLRMALKGGIVGNYREGGISKRVREEWGVEISDDYLEIDEEKGTYRITRTDADYNSELVDEGKL